MWRQHARRFSFRIFLSAPGMILAWVQFVSTTPGAFWRPQSVARIWRQRARRWRDTKPSQRYFRLKLTYGVGARHGEPAAGLADTGGLRVAHVRPLLVNADSAVVRLPLTYAVGARHGEPAGCAPYIDIVSAMPAASFRPCALVASKLSPHMAPTGSEMARYKAFPALFPVDVDLWRRGSPWRAPSGHMARGSHMCDPYIDIVSAMPSASFRPCAPPQRRFNTLATNAGATLRLAG